MMIKLPKYRMASIKLVSRWDIGCRKYATCYISQIGPVWVSVDRKRRLAV